ncbi:putative leucine-rich repeat protein [Strigomonas culicis]|uniref:Putative leucine-rich repeat protein n=1 Tax=Strigomonas culicis TaxID=28005 RepID=S9V818_9TRYP|nr:putative leucine-rich repeat protein [Strigomonas culicis]|eukprot:EPY37204.1 putative leucine-rich repeat protein [Strigomonas culicis]
MTSEPNSDTEVDLPTLYAYEEVERVKSKEELIVERFRELHMEAFPAKEFPESDPTGGKSYLHACNQINKDSFMIFPTQSIANELAKDKETLDLSHANLGVKGCTALAAALRINTTATALVLVGNHMGATGALEVVKAIHESRNVTQLDLSSNGLGKVELSGGTAAQASTVIRELFATGSLIESLSLRDNGIGDADTRTIAEVLSENTVLHELDLSYNQIGYLGAIELSKMLSQNVDLRVINLEWNNFRNTGASKLLSEGVLNNNTLKTVNLSACGLDDACAVLLGRGHQCKTRFEEFYVGQQSDRRGRARSHCQGLTCFRVH